MLQRSTLSVICLFGFVSVADAQIYPDELFRGDANGDGVVNISDVGFISAYVNRGGDPPECFDAADAADDGGGHRAGVSTSSSDSDS